MSIWTPGRIPNVGTRHALGVWLNYRKLSSGIQIPNQKDRRQFYGKTIVHYPIFDMVVQPQDTQRGSFTARGNLKIAALLGSYVDQPAGENPASTAGFQVQFFDAGKQQLWSTQPVTWNLQLGNAQKPFWLRSPYSLDPQCQLTCVVTSLSPNPSAIQVTCFGYQD